MKQYHDYLKYILEHGVKKEDRTGTGTISIFGYQMRFDLSKGFPLVTTKKLHFKSIAYELLWFLSGDTNTKFLNDNGVTIWNEWKQHYSLDRDIVFIDPINHQDYIPYNGNYSRHGINATAGSIEDKLAGTWVKMMRRCYDSTHHNYKFYGELGVSVCKEWHDPSKFISDAQKLPHWQYKLEDWNRFELDKDYYGSNVYSIDSCVWLRTDENNLYTKSCTPLLIIDDKGKKKIYISLNYAGEKLNIPSSTLCRFVNNQNKTQILKGNNKKFKNWVFQKIEIQDKLPRLKLISKGDLGPVYSAQWRNWKTSDGNTIDQISDLINQIKNNPDSRRLIVSAWNVGELKNMALPPCHAFFQFYVADNKLSCMLTQRSADSFLGVPYNIASYSLLTYMIAQQCDLEVGEFIWSGGDCHIYTNHIEQVKLQLNREPYELPKLNIKRKPESIFDYKFEDFEIIGYKAHPNIKGQVAV